VSLGTGGATAALGGTLSSNVTATSTTGLVEETLMQYTLPANTLAVNGRGLRFTVTCTFAANANAKACKLYFGAAVIAQSGAVVGSPNGSTYVALHTLTRISATTQHTSGVDTVGASGASIANTQGTETLSGAVLIKVTGTGPTTIGDITATQLLVEAI
jgi:hypothetical protein